jgi:hypothetical protein
MVIVFDLDVVCEDDGRIGHRHLLCWIPLRRGLALACESSRMCVRKDMRFGDVGDLVVAWFALSRVPVVAQCFRG